MKDTLFTRLSKPFSTQTLTLSLLAVLVGVLTGAAIWLFKWLIEYAHRQSFGLVSGWMVVLIPAAGGLIVGLLTRYFDSGKSMHGTAGVMQAVALTGGRIHYQKTPIKTIQAIISIGSGASLGPEDPSVQIGASFGSMFGQLLHLSEERTAALVAAGVAAAIAAAFNAPIAGVFFAVEIILGEISTSALTLILATAVSSAVFTQAVSGTSPAFPIPAYAFNSVYELPLYLALGLLAAPVSALYIRLIGSFRRLFSRWNIANLVKPVISGLIIGAVGLVIPQVLGTGYETIGQVLNNTSFDLKVLAILMIVKVILTPFSLGGGFVGGVFAPALFIGATLGGGFGALMNLWFPNLGLHPAAFALVGMAAVLSGTVRAPLTCILLLFEMTNDYRIILPLMFSVAVSFAVSRKLQADSVYEMGLAEQGIRLDRGRDIEILSTLTVSEVMRSEPETLSDTTSLDEAEEILLKSHENSLPVLNDQGFLEGILSIQDIEKADARLVKDACSKKVEVAYPEETVNLALRRMSKRDIGMLPVVNQHNPGELLGVLRRADIIHAYTIGLSRRASQRHRQEAVRLDGLTPPQVQVFDVTVQEKASIANKKLKEIPFPPECIIASIRRGNQVFIPRGETTIFTGDILVIVTKSNLCDLILGMCKTVFVESEY